jgi:TRAP-type C4-dicarboxylate transport system substrate-binding protein
MSTFKTMNFQNFTALMLLLGGLLWTPFTTAATLKIATLSPEGSSWMKVLRKHGKAVEQRTDGAVKFKFYPGGVMGDDKAVLRKMRVGQLHGAVLTAGGLVQAYPDIALYNMPMLFRDNEEIDYVRENMDDRLMVGLREQNYVGFGFAEVGFAYPMSRLPTASVEQMQQRKVWTPDNDIGSLRAFEAFKIAPIPLPISDVLAGLQTGLIDTLASPPIGAIALQWHTQVQQALELPLMYIYGLLAMAERPFEKLTAEQQAIVTEEFQRAVRTADESARRDHNSAKAALGKQGVVWQTPSKLELQEWLRLAEEARRRLIDSNYVSAQLYQEALDLLNRYRGAGG